MLGGGDGADRALQRIWPGLPKRRLRHRLSCMPQTPADLLTDARKTVPAIGAEEAKARLDRGEVDLIVASVSRSSGMPVTSLAHFKSLAA